jgi:hypothetical protein
MPADTLKPQDVFVASLLAIAGKTSATHEWLAKTLHLSSSTVFESLKRCRHAKLVTGTEHGVKIVPQRLYDFLVHAVPVLYYPRRVAPVRGIATAVFSPLFRDRFTKSGDLVMVWPYSKGKELGEGLLPIYPSIPIACSQNPALYELMAAIEVLRVGKVREKAAAVSYLGNVLEVDSVKPAEEEGAA